MAQRMEIATEFTVQLHFEQWSTVYKKLLQWPKALNKFAAMANTAEILSPWPTARKTVKVKYLGEFESIFKTALVHESGDQLGTFDEIKKDIRNLMLLSLKQQNT
jgi:hypothetical protein